MIRAFAKKLSIALVLLAGGVLPVTAVNCEQMNGGSFSLFRDDDSGDYYDDYYYDYGYGYGCYDYCF